MADPPEHVVLNAVDFARQHRVDIVIGIGGGSSMDFAGQAFSNSPVAAVHALAYPIGGIFHVPHGLSNSLVRPHVLRFNIPAALDHYAEIAGIKAPHVEGSPEARAEALIVAMQQIAKMTRIETTLQQGGSPKPIRTAWRTTR
jgi:alcohol dehydrogenase class IV